MRQDRPRLSGLEHQVMEILWRRGECSSHAVGQALGRRPPLKEATVRTLLRRLAAKGYVSKRMEGRAYVYRPTVAADQAATSAVRQLIERYCQGSAERLLVGLLDNEIITPKQVQGILRRLKDEQAGEKP